MLGGAIALLGLFTLLNWYLPLTEQTSTVSLPATGCQTPRTGAGASDDDFTSIWSGVLVVGADQQTDTSQGYSLVDGMGSLAPAALLWDGTQLGILSAIQSQRGFSIALSGQQPLPTEFTLRVRDPDDGEIANLSSCDSLRRRTNLGERFLWPSTHLNWATGDRFTLSLELDPNSGDAKSGSAQRLLQPLTAHFEQAPPHHTSEPFTLDLQFTEPVKISRESLQVTAATILSLEPAEEALDLWRVAIAPDNRRSIRIRLLAATDCQSNSSICTQHGIRLSNQPEVVIPGPELTAEFLEIPEHHSAQSSVTVQVAFSEPATGMLRSLRADAIQISGGRLSALRRVEDRSDLIELTLIPESSEDIELALVSPDTCDMSSDACLSDLRRLSNQPTVAIPAGRIHFTFDDGPSPYYTPRVLNILARYDARATFFVIGSVAAYYPELIERIIEEGHTLANHTWNHESLPSLTAEELEATVTRAQRFLGEHATSCIRPPFYAIDAESAAQLNNLGYEIVMGTVRSGDWALPGVDEIVSRILTGAKADAVIVLHDGGGERGQTLEALEIVLNRLQSQRFAYEPLCH